MTDLKGPWIEGPAPNAIEAMRTDALWVVHESMRGAVGFTTEEVGVLKTMIEQWISEGFCAPPYTSVQYDILERLGIVEHAQYDVKRPTANDHQHSIDHAAGPHMCWKSNCAHQPAVPYLHWRCKDCGQVIEGETRFTGFHLVLDKDQPLRLRDDTHVGPGVITWPDGVPNPSLICEGTALIYGVRVEAPGAYSVSGSPDIQYSVWLDTEKHESKQWP